MIPSHITIFLWHYCNSFVLVWHINTVSESSIRHIVFVITETLQPFWWFWAFILPLSLFELRWFLTYNFFNSILLFFASFVRRYVNIFLRFLLFTFPFSWWTFLSDVLDWFICRDISTSALYIILFLFTYLIVLLFNTANADTENQDHQHDTNWRKNCYA